MEILCWSKMWKITTLFWILFWTKNSNVLGDECWSHWVIKTLICLLRLRYFWVPEIPQWNFHLTFVPGIINYRFLTTETNLKDLYIFCCFFTTSSVKLFLVNVQILFTIVLFGKRKSNTHKTFHLLKMKAHFEKEPHFESESTFQNKLDK